MDHSVNGLTNKTETRGIAVINGGKDKENELKNLLTFF